jgi:hypothetical protein
LRGLLDGRKRPHPVSRRNYKGPVRFEGPVRHALILNKVYFYPQKKKN